MAGSEKKTVADSIYGKLHEIQTELKVPKSEWNDHSKFHYRTAEGILEALKPHLKKHGLLLVLNDEAVLSGNYNYIKATVTLSDGKDEITTSALAREQEVRKGMDASQITGATSSYARKYALNGMFAIDDTKDADSHDNTQHVSKPTRKPKSSELATDKQRQLIQQKLAAQGISQENTKGYLIEQFGVEVPLTKEGASFVIEELIERQQEEELNQNYMGVDQWGN